MALTGGEVRRAVVVGKATRSKGEGGTDFSGCCRKRRKQEYKQTNS